MTAARPLIDAGTAADMIGLSRREIVELARRRRLLPFRVLLARDDRGRLYPWVRQADAVRWQGQGRALITRMLRDWW